MEGIRILQPLVISTEFRILRKKRTQCLHDMRALRHTYAFSNTCFVFLFFFLSFVTRTHTLAHSFTIHIVPTDNQHGGCHSILYLDQRAKVGTQSQAKVLSLDKRRIQDWSPPYGYFSSRKRCLQENKRWRGI